MQIIPAARDDAQTILALQQRAYQQEAQIYDDYTIPPLTQTLNEILTEFDTHSFLKAVKNGRIVGSVRAFTDDDTCHIGRLIVEPDDQGQGIGTLLMAAIEKMFAGCRRFELFTGTLSKGNIRLYKRLGYVPFKEQQIHQGLSLLFFEKMGED
jgi:GNAT superfamily N-acetyltransferase